MNTNFKPSRNHHQSQPKGVDGVNEIGEFVMRELMDTNSEPSESHRSQREGIHGVNESIICHGGVNGVNHEAN